MKGTVTDVRPAVGRGHRRSEVELVLVRGVLIERVGRNIRRHELRSREAGRAAMPRSPNAVMRNISIPSIGILVCRSRDAPDAIILSSQAAIARRAPASSKLHTWPRPRLASRQACRQSTFLRNESHEMPGGEIADRRFLVNEIIDQHFVRFRQGEVIR